MKFDVVTIFPEMLDSVIDFGITGQACDRGLMSIQGWNPRAFTTDVHRVVDDRPYGGGPGMVMKPEPLAKCLDAVMEKRGEGAGPVIYLSPQGQRFNQAKARELASLSQMTLLCGRYEGVDERVLSSRVDEEISIGDYVLAGGELAAMVMIETVARLLPGVLGNEQSAEQDSFSGELLDCHTSPDQRFLSRCPFQRCC